MSDSTKPDDDEPFDEAIESWPVLQATWPSTIYWNDFSLRTNE